MEVFWLDQVSVPFVEETFFSADPTCSTFIFAEHPPTVTFGRNMGEDHIKEITSLIASRSEQNIEFCRVQRGGKATYHGPGHLMIYPRVQQATLGLGASRFVSAVLTVIRERLKNYGVVADLDECCQGLWVSALNERRKLASVGFRLGRGYSSYGVDLYVEEVGDVFGFFSPCGIESCEFTSVRKELGDSHITTYDLAQDLARDFNMAFSL